MGPIGMQEMIAIFIFALLLFGPKKLPELGKTLGKALTEFRRAKNELKSTFEGHLSELERETRIEPYTYSDSSHTNYSSPYVHDEYGRYDSTASDTPVEAATDTPPAQGENKGAAPTENHHETAPVPGTVARSNGVHPVESAAPLAEEKRPA